MAIPHNDGGKRRPGLCSAPAYFVANGVVFFKLRYFKLQKRRTSI